MIPFTPGQTPKVNVQPPQDLQTKLAGGNYGEKVGAEQVGGVKKILGSIQSGADTLKNRDTNSSLENLKGVAKAGLGTFVGAGQVALAPIAPATSWITKTITPALRKANPELAKAYDLVAPKVKELADKHPESATLISDAINTALWMIPGGKVLSKVKTPVKEAIASKLEGITTENINKVIDKNYSKSITPSGKKTVELNAKQLENNREAVKLISENKSNLKYFDENGNVIDSGFAPRNVSEHAQALTQTAEQIWNKQIKALQDSNAKIFFDNPIKIIESELKSLGTSSTRYKPLLALLERYKNQGAVDPVKFSSFITELNDEGKSFLQSGSSLPKAKSAVFVGNLFREELDKVMQQLGTPEISLLRRQYGALESTSKDVARTLNKLSKGEGAGGVSRLADLFSAEEIGRGLLTLDSSSIARGVVLQGTKIGLKWFRSPNRYINKLYSALEKVSGQEIPRLKSPYSVKERAGLPVIKGQVKPVKTPKVIELPGKIGGFDEPQASKVSFDIHSVPDKIIRKYSLDNEKVFTDPKMTPLANQQYSILTAENPMNKTLTPAENKILNDKLIAQLKKDGYTPIPVEGNYGKPVTENSFFVPGMTNAEALKYGKMFDQESVLTPKGFIYQNGTYHPADLKNISFDKNMTEYYSKINIGDTSVKFSIPINFDKTLKLNSLTGKLKK